MTLPFNTIFHQRDVRETPASTATATAVGLTDGKYIVVDYHADMTDERKITAGEGIDFTDNGANSTFVISGEDATTANKGIASFATADFTVAGGAVSVKAAVKTMVFGGNIGEGIIEDAETAYACISGSTGASEMQTDDPDEHYIIFPKAGTLKNFYTYITLNQITGAGDTTISIYLNGAQQSIQTTYASGATGEESDTGNTVAIAAGDRVCIELIGGGTAGNLRTVMWGVEFQIT